MILDKKLFSPKLSYIKTQYCNILLRLVAGKSTFKVEAKIDIPNGASDRKLLEAMSHKVSIYDIWFTISQLFHDI